MKEQASAATPVLCVVGPTASGKSAWALSLANDYPIEIISIDSAQVYRGMDIGTAKPDAATRAAVPHHLIDLIDPLDHYDAAQCRRDAVALIEQIRARGRQPVLVGGTLLYVQALLTGLDALPPRDAILRRSLELELAEQGLSALYARLQTVDPISAKRIDANDRQRIQRALEVFHSTGQPLSQAHSGFSDTAKGLSLQLVALEPSTPDTRALLKQRIAERWDEMMAQGFLAEVATLKARGDLHADLPAMRCVGYRQAWAHLDGDLNAAELRERAIVATRQLAKRQLTWLRRWPMRQAFDPFTVEGKAGLETLRRSLWQSAA